MHTQYSIIIPAYNEAAELPRTLQSIRACMALEPMRGECIVVDNNSTDGTSEIAKTHGADKVVKEPINQIARARNTGARASNGKYLIFIDADTRVKPKLVSQAIRLLQEGSHAGGGALVHFESEVGLIGRFGIGLWERISKLTQIAAGSFLFCSREAFEAVGGYDETLYASEEVRFSRQIRKWAKTRGQRFKIIEDAPALTSARKLQWYSGFQILKSVALMMILPVAVKSRRLCAFWYERPDGNSPA
jgi:glycosyltransferase involved in cell wall biosynthesis